MEVGQSMTFAMLTTQMEVPHITCQFKLIVVHRVLSGLDSAISAGVANGTDVRLQLLRQQPTYTVFGSLEFIRLMGVSKMPFYKH